MAPSDETLERLVELVRQDAAARGRELEHLNERLEERNRLLEKQLGRRAGAAKWFAAVAGLAAIITGVWVYALILNVGHDMHDMSTQMQQMHVYMQNMAAGEPLEGDASYMASMAHNIDRMADDIGVMRVEMNRVSTDINVMRTAMTDMSGDIGKMNIAMHDLGGDMKSMRENIGGMAQSVGHMNRNVGRLSRDAQNLRNPFPGMMPW